jgi:hypothetical protein
MPDSRRRTLFLSLPLSKESPIMKSTTLFSAFSAFLTIPLVSAIPQYVSTIYGTTTYVATQYPATTAANMGFPVYQGHYIYPAANTAFCLTAPTNADGAQVFIQPCTKSTCTSFVPVLRSVILNSKRFLPSSTILDVRSRNTIYIWYQMPRRYEWVNGQREQAPDLGLYGQQCEPAILADTR